MIKSRACSAVMSNASHTDVMSALLTTVPVDRLSLHDGPALLQLSTEHVVVVQKKKGEAQTEETDFRHLVSRNAKQAF